MDIISVPARHALHIAEPKLKLDLTKYVEHHEYFFDQVFEDNVSNEQVAFRAATKDKHTLASCRFPAKPSGSKDEHALSGRFENVRTCYWRAFRLDSCAACRFTCRRSVTWSSLCFSAARRRALHSAECSHPISYLTRCFTGM